MREIPECLNRRYQALDGLIKEIRSALPSGDKNMERLNCCGNKDRGIKLMCDFWNILEDDPNCNLTQEVQQRLGVEKKNIPRVPPRAHRCVPDKNVPQVRHMHRIKRITVPTEPRTPPRRGCSASCSGGERMSLSQVLCNLKEAASFDQRCSVRVGELLKTQNDLTDQITVLEEREKQGVSLLKQADCMWSCMEETYKKKVAESQERYNSMLKELREIEMSTNKWRKNKKDLEFQLGNIEKSNKDVVEKLNQKKNDITIMKIEIEDFTKRIASNAKDLEVAKNSYKSKREASDARIATISSELKKLKTKVGSEYKFKAVKEQEGTKYIKEARDDLQKICRVLLQKKLENEDLRAEKEAIIQEIELLKKTCDNCRDRCTMREKSIDEEMKRVEKELNETRVKCIKCHQCTDTIDIRKFCTDCPRCLRERDCLYEDDHCSPDHSLDCVCMAVKQKFLDNVFDNMYTVLERQTKTCPGKAVADCILHCLKRSRNGKLNEETRKVLQDFILSTVKKNLNLTIVGGAVKTRCEMDPETYKQLMLCLKDVVGKKPTKEDKGTKSRKGPCERWGGTRECNCPKGPKACICTKKALPPPSDPISCGPPQSDGTDTGEKTCPRREELACGTDCGMLGLPGNVHKREPCAGQTCPFSSNMRAAQCALGPESVAQVLKPVIPGLTVPKTATCDCGDKAVKLCPCHKDAKHLKAEVKDACTKSACANCRGLTKDIKSVDKEQKETLEEYSKTIPYKNDTPEQLQVAIENEIGQLSHQLTVLTQTKSGRLAMELDESVIDILENQSKIDSHLFISINKTNSGHVLLNFAAKENLQDNTQRVTIRRTNSGTRVLDIHKNVISVLRDTLPNNNLNSLPQGIKLSSNLSSRQSQIQFAFDKYITPTDLEKDINKILQSQDSNNIDEHEIELKCSNKTTPDMVCCKLISGAKGTSTTSHKDNILPCTCPKTSSGSVCCQQSGINVYPKTISCPPPVDKLRQFNGKKKENLIDRDLEDNPVHIDKNLLTQQKGKKKPLKSDEKYIPSKIKRKDESKCKCSKKMQSRSVCCKLLTEFDFPQESLTTNSWKTAISKSLISADESTFSLEFKQLYKQGNAKVSLKIQGQNGISRKLATVVTKTTSDIIAIHAKNTPSLLELCFEDNEFPVLLSKTVSDTYFVNFDDNDVCFNAILRKTPSGGILLIPVNSRQYSVENVLKVKIGSKNQLIELSAVIRKTRSENYLIVLDKEFENKYKKIIRKYIGHKYECGVELHRSNSGNYVIELGSENPSYAGKANAVLVKSSSGTIKIFVNGSDFESMAQTVSTDSSISSAQPFAKIVKKLPASSREFHRGNLLKSKTLNKKASSDTQLLEKIKVKLQDNKRLLSEPSAVLKKTKSGQYAIVLNKESKKAFINNLQSYLSTHSKGLVPIKRSDSGEIIINLNNTQEANGHYGSLKITSSGNIYVVVDENVIKDMTVRSFKEEASSPMSGRSKHVQQLIDSVNKAVATTCHARPEDCSYNAKCVCDELQYDTIDWSNDVPANQVISPSCKKVVANADNRNGSAPKNISRHIVIKPNSDCQSESNNNFGSTEQCYYLLDTDCPHYQYRYCKPNNLLQVSKQYKVRDKFEFEVNCDLPKETGAHPVWDSLNYLPPQLPPFLQNISYR